MARSIHRRTPLLLGGAGLAVAAILALPSPAGAQAFNGSPVFVRGSGNVDRSVPNVDTITISSATAVLDWTVFEDNFGNALTFLPTGHTAFFQDTPGQGGFAVLNRILPSTNGNVVVFDGTVVSRLLAADSTRSSGGTVAFYSPTGILVGGNAVFDVGQLLLTTLDPDLDSFDNYAAGGTLQLTGAPGATAAVDIASGAQITANGEGSYFAVAAPQILMRGNAYINGTTAYVAGEQVNLRYNNGLFDILIPVGTSVGTPIDHSGTTGGPASTGSGDNHLIYAVSRAAANPIAMLLRGNLGFDTAATAGVDNGDIILSAGYDVFGRSVSTGPVDSGAVLESISILGSTMLTSSVFAGATGHFDANSNDGAIDFSDDLTVRAARSISLTARNGNDLTIAGNSSFEARGTIAASGDVTGGDISLTARDSGTLSFFGNLSAFATPTQRDGNSTGGTIGLVADNGTLAVDGEVTLFAQANDFFPTGTLGDGFGGTISLLSRNDGLIDLGSTLRMDTTAFGNGFAGRTATAGANEIVAQNGGRIDIAGSVSLQASGFGGDADGASGVIDGGAGIGGFIQILAEGGSISFGSTLSIGAEGFGGAGASSFGAGPGDVGGLGQGGQVLINAIDGSISISGDASLLARGFGGEGGSGGNAIGGLTQVFADGSGSIDLAGVTAAAHALGGDGSADDGRGGDAEGGQSLLLTLGTGDIRLTGDASIQANAFGGDGHSGGDATGGNAGIYAIFGSIAIDGDANLAAVAGGGDATVGFGGNGGDALGGTAFVQADGSELASASLRIAGNASMSADGFGGDGGAGDGAGVAAGNGGNGTGGTFQGSPGTGGAYALAGRDGGSLEIGGQTIVRAVGSGGTGGVGGTGQSGGAGGIGTGGTTQAGTFSGLGDGSLGAGRAIFSSLSLSSDGIGGFGGAGAAGLGLGGVGQGGFAGVFAVNSRVDAGIIATAANGIGGSGSTGGNGIGGRAGIGVVAGVLNATSAIGRADGVGGDATTGDGGDGTGGEASIDLGSTLNVSGDIDYHATGRGGGSESGTGGLGEGGIARITATAGSNFTAGGFIDLDASADGGTGVMGGDARGGSVRIEVQDNSTVSAGGLFLEAGGYAGIDAAGQPSGSAMGGLVQVIASGGSSLSADTLEILAHGDGTAGSFEIEADGGTIRLNSLLALATGSEAGAASLIRAANGAIPISGFAGFLTTGDLDIATANGGLIGGPTAADPTAGLFVWSDGTVTIAGDDDDHIGFGGQSLFVRAREFDILPGARIGAEFLGLMVAGNDGITVVGGVGDTEGYTLTQAEGERIDAGSVIFFASNEGAASDDILVRDLTVAGSLDEGLSSLFILAGGTVRVEGTLSYLNAAGSDQFAIFAPRLEIVTPGGIGMVDPQGNPAGNFTFFGRDFWMADSPTISQLQDSVMFSGRDDLLATATPGSTDPLGYLRSGNIMLLVGNSLLVRNTGSSDAPAGITVSDSLRIIGVDFSAFDFALEFDFEDFDPASFMLDFDFDPLQDLVSADGPLDVVAFGRKRNPDGSFVTGAAFNALVDFTNAANGDLVTTYTDGSRLNNCSINTGECIGADPPDKPEEPDQRKEALNKIEKQAPATAVTTTEPVARMPVEQSEEDSNVEFGADFPGLLNASLFEEEDAIDDPVASGGDIALYGASDDEEDAGDANDEAGEDTDAQ